MAELFLSFASYRPNLIVPPRFLSVPFIIFPSLFHSSINPITGKQFLSNSLEPAFLIFKIMKKEKCISKGVTIGGDNMDVYMPQFINFFKENLL